MLKRLFFLGVMMGVVAAPYLLSSSSDWWNSIGSQFAGKTDPQASGASTAAEGSSHASPAKAGLAAGAKPTATPVEGFGAHDLAEVLQFDGTPAWVMARWPRVTAGLAELDLQGYRVPLVTGTGDGDLAGSLTYYFDKNQRINYITFRGTTGDPRKLIALVTSRYHFTQQKTDDPSQALYQVKWNGKPQSELRIKPARIVRANQPHSRYEIELAMKRPS